MAELETATSDAPDTDLPSVEDDPVADESQAEAVEQEQPEAETDTPEQVDDDETESEEDEEESGLFDELDDDEESEESEEQTPQLTDADFDSYEVTLPGIDEPVTGRELKDGYLRNADYTQKRQRDAERMKALEAEFGEAKQLYDRLRENPVGFFKALADSIEVDVDLKGVDPEGFKLPSKEDIEAEIEKRVQERVAQDPRVQSAQADAAVNEVMADLARIEQTRGVKLSKSDRVKLLKEAQRRNVADLELVYDALQARIQQKRQKRKETKKTTTVKSKGRVPEQEVTAPPKSIRDAMERALAERSG